MSESDIKQFATEIHKPVVRKFKRRKVIVFGKNEIWSLDIVDMQKFASENEGNKYMLNCIDCFTRYAWAIPMKTKTADETLVALKTIIQEAGAMPQKLWVDKGSEFLNNKWKIFLDENNITIYHTYSENKAVIIERFNRTLKTKMFLQFSINRNHNWTKILPKLLKDYNNSVHRSIGVTPTQAYEKKNEEKLKDRLYTLEYKKPIKPKFKVGEKVRISKVKRTFEKGYEANWTYEIFKITKVIHSNPPTYNIEDLYGEPILGSFYEQELQHTTLNNIHTREIDKIENEFVDLMKKYEKK